VRSLRCRRIVCALLTVVPRSTQFIGALELRLSDEQKQVICFNRATLLLHSNKVRCAP
jgi:hypothetical protein